tara:strand:- start:6 stop:227 length:222 start_codon:yes stop_codon:yes gene_type:complete
MAFISRPEQLDKRLRRAPPSPLDAPVTRIIIDPKSFLLIVKIKHGCQEVGIFVFIQNNPVHVLKGFKNRRTRR